MFPGSGQRGHTVTEVAIVLVLMLILLKSAAPAVGHALSEATLKTASNQVAACFRFARQAAVTGRIYTLVTQGPDHGLLVANAATGVALRRFGLPGSAVITGSFPAFTPQGICTVSGRVSVAEGSSSSLVTCNPVGLVEVVYP